MKTAVIYARYSSDNQTEQSIEGQVRVCQQYAERNDIIIVDQYIDRATTGTNDNRTSFQQMLKDSKKKQWNLVLVYKLDRFARNRYEAAINRKKLKDNCVDLVSAMEQIPDTPEGKLFLSIIEGYNEYFSADLTQKVNRGLRESWLKGNATGGKPPYGWDIVNKKYVVNEYEAEVVRQIFAMYAQGQTANTIVKHLCEQGVVSKVGKPMNIGKVYQILHDRKYTGVINHQGEDYYNIFPRIIDDDVWRQVIIIFDDNKHCSAKEKDVYNFILSGKLICGKCKGKMRGDSGTSHMGTKYHYYSCSNKKRKRNKCTCKPVKKEFIENLVIDATMSLLQSNTTIKEIAKNIVRINTKKVKQDSSMKLLQKKKCEATKAASNIVSAIEKGIINEFTKDRLAELQEEIVRLDFEINKEKQRTYALLTVEEVEKFLLSNVFDNTDDIKARKQLVRSFVRQVIWYNDKVIITYNIVPNADRTPTLTPEQIIQIEKQVERNSQPAFTINPFCDYSKTKFYNCLITLSFCKDCFAIIIKIKAPVT